jgi:tetratricopeptide (TPR) repeat protein
MFSLDTAYAGQFRRGILAPMLGVTRCLFAVQRLTFAVLVTAVSCLLVTNAHGQAVATADDPRDLGRAVMLDAEGKPREAITRIEAALREHDASTPKDDLESARLLSNLARLQAATGDSARAAASGARLKRWMAGASKPELSRLAELETVIGEMYRTRRAYERAVKVHTFALGIRKLVLGPTSEEAAASMAYLGLTHLQREELPIALPLLEEALRIRRALPAPDDLAIAASAHNLAAARRKSGNLAGAEKLYLEALKLRISRLGPSDPEVAITLNSLGALDSQRGNQARAEERLSRALEINLVHDKQLEAAETRVNLGIVLSHRGAVKQAERVLGQALDWCRTHPDQAGQELTAGAMNAMGVVQLLKGDAAGSRDLTLKAQRELAGSDVGPTLQAALACNGADSLSLHGQHQAALQGYFVCMNMFSTALGGENNPDVAVAMRGLATEYGHLKDFARAQGLASKAVKILEQTVGEQNEAFAGTAYTLSLLLRADNRLGDAVGWARRSSDIHERVASAILAGGAEADKRAFFRTIVPNTYQTLSLHLLSAPGDTLALRLAFETLLRRKGRVLDSARDTLASVRKRAAPADLATLDELRAVRSAIASRAKLKPGSAGGADLEPLTSRADALERALAARYPAMVDDRRQTTLEAIQARLRPSQALVEFALFDAVGAEELEPRLQNANWEYAAYVLLSTGAPKFVRLGPAEPIVRSVAGFLAELKDPTTTPKGGRALDALVMAKVRPLLEGRREVYLSPDGALNLLPFSALTDENERYLLEEYEFTYLSSGRDLLAPASKPLGLPVVVAVSDFGAGKAASSRGDQPFPPLKHVQAEADVVQHYFPRARMLRNDQATKTALLELHGPSLLHIATHGYFSAPTVDQSPLLASGIALFGANDVNPDGSRGVLTAFEAASMDLRGTELVVVSACESGQGAVLDGDGIYGLRRSLVLAGSQAQLLSLWRVDDDLIRNTLETFYADLSAGHGRSQALRTAQLGLLREPRTRLPYHWAALVMSGESGPISVARPSPPPVAPGSRGCSCRAASSEGSAWGWAGCMATLLALPRWRRRSARTGSVRVGVES